MLYDKKYFYDQINIIIVINVDLKEMFKQIAVLEFGFGATETLLIFDPVNPLDIRMVKCIFQSITKNADFVQY